MEGKAKAIYTLYRINRITLEGVRQAVISGIITEEEYKLITNKDFE